MYTFPAVVHSYVFTKHNNIILQTITYQVYKV
jgi:hypothetical protein